MQAIIVAAGSGERFGGPKALLPLAGRPLVSWSVLAFRQAGASCIVVVGRKEDQDALASHAGEGVVVVPGGATRAASVRAGVGALPPGDERVLVHDAARPLVPVPLIRRLAEVDADVAIPVLDLEDTLRATVPGTPQPERERLWRVQTPQSFRREVLAAVARSGVSASDEAQVAERLGYQVLALRGARRNFKITWPEDLSLAEAVLRGEEGGRMRTGQGLDVHRLIPGRPLILAGVHLPEDVTGGLGLDGHSDADVVLHAVMDACLGAAGLPDIGHLFPPEDERWRDSDSRLLLQDVLHRVAAQGLRPWAVDVTLVAQRPKIAPYWGVMQERLAELLGVPRQRVGLKATTPEGLGPLGHGEGVAAFALVTLQEVVAP